MFLSFLKKKSNTSLLNPLMVDVHSHVLPAIDDGVQTMEEAIAVLEALASDGYRKVIATPHVMQGYYENSRENILEVALQVNKEIKKRGIKIVVEAAAEYYFDDTLLQKIHQKQPLLTFGGENKYLLFETTFVVEPKRLEEGIAEMILQGYTPVMAHPERCIYLQKNRELLQKIFQKGVLFQINSLSLTGFYSTIVQQFTEELIEQKMIHFFGSNYHRFTQIESIREAQQLPLFKKGLAIGLLNNSLA